MTRRKINSRRSTVAQDIDLLDPVLQRDAKRIQRQQKRLEKTTGIATVTQIQTRQRAIKIDDVKVLEPLTDTQHDVFDAFENPDNMAFVLYGSAGTGKTFLAMYHALLEVLDPNTQYEKIILIRSAVSSRDTGFLPGTAEEKLEPYEAIYHSIFGDLTGKKDAYEHLKGVNKIEFMPTSFLRGATFNNSIVIVDESQNMSWEEIATVTTRIGKNSKLILIGDTKQNDLHYKKNDVSGFPQFIEVAKRMPEFNTFKFTPDDIVRSQFVKRFLTVCDQMGF